MQLATHEHEHEHARTLNGMAESKSGAPTHCLFSCSQVHSVSGLSHAVSPNACVSPPGATQRSRLPRFPTFNKQPHTPYPRVALSAAESQSSLILSSLDCFGAFGAFGTTWKEGYSWSAGARLTALLLQTLQDPLQLLSMYGGLWLHSPHAAHIPQLEW